MISAAGKKCCERVPRKGAEPEPKRLLCAVCNRQLCAWHSAGQPTMPWVTAKPVELMTVCFPSCAFLFNLALEFVPEAQP